MHKHLQTVDIDNAREYSADHIAVALNADLIDTTFLNLQKQIFPKGKAAAVSATWLKKC